MTYAEEGAPFNALRFSKSRSVKHNAMMFSIIPSG